MADITNSRLLGQFERSGVYRRSQRSGSFQQVQGRCAIRRIRVGGNLTIGSGRGYCCKMDFSSARDLNGKSALPYRFSGSKSRNDACVAGVRSVDVVVFYAAIKIEREIG